MKALLILPLVPLLVATALAANAPATQRDYQKLAERTAFTWDDDEATAKYSMDLVGPRYAVTSVQNNLGVFTFDVTKAGKSVFTFTGHEFTTFQVVKDILYYAEYRIRDSGGRIVAVDLTTGKELWRGGIITHIPGHVTTGAGSFQQRIVIRATAQEILVLSLDCLGGELMYLDPANGNIVGSRSVDGVRMPATDK